MDSTTLDEKIADIEMILSKPEDIGTKAEVYERISGYYRSVANFNDGKLQETKERKAYKIT